MKQRLLMGKLDLRTLTSHVEDFPYRPIRFLETDSKMSRLLLAEADDGMEVVVKIGCTERPALAELNQQAIVNEALWLSHFGNQQGIVQLWSSEKPKRYKGQEEPAETLIQTLPLPGEPKYFILEYLSGGALNHFVGNNRLRVEMALRIAHYVARSLAKIHEGQCVHRDLKPENILFARSPRSQSDIDDHVPTIIDFGVAAQIGTKRMVSGSRLWMAPELQEAYERTAIRVQPSGDIYALGLILCYMITGRKPRRRNYDYASHVAYMERTIDTLRQDAFESTVQPLEITVALIRRMLLQDAGARPTAQEFADETTNLLAQYGRPIPPAASRFRSAGNPRAKNSSARNHSVQKQSTQKQSTQKQSTQKQRALRWVPTSIIALCAAALVIIMGLLIWPERWNGSLWEREPNPAQPAAGALDEEPEPGEAAEQPDSDASVEPPPAPPLTVPPTLVPLPTPLTDSSRGGEQGSEAALDGETPSVQAGPTLVPLPEVLPSAVSAITSTSGSTVTLE